MGFTYIEVIFCGIVALIKTQKQPSMSGQKQENAELIY